MAEKDTPKEIPEEDILKEMPEEDILKEMPEEDILKEMPEEDILKEIPEEDPLEKLKIELRKQKVTFSGDAKSGWKIANIVVGAEEAPKLLLQVLEETRQLPKEQLDEFKFVPRWAIYYLGKIGEQAPKLISSKVITALLKVLKDELEAPSVHKLVVEALGRIGEKKGAKEKRMMVHPLIQALEDQDKTVRGEAFFAFRRMGELPKEYEGKLLEALTKALHDGKENTRQWAIWVLEDRGEAGKKIIEEYRKTISDSIAGIEASAEYFYLFKPREYPVYAFLLYTDANENLAAFVKDNLRQLNAMSGGTCLLFLLDCLSRIGEATEEREKMQSSFEHIQFIRFKEIEDIRSAGSAIYPIANFFGLLPRHLPCLVFFRNIHTKKPLVYLIDNSSADYNLTREFEKIFSIIIKQVRKSKRWGKDPSKRVWLRLHLSRLRRKVFAASIATATQHSFEKIADVFRWLIDKVI